MCLNFIPKFVGLFSVFLEVLVIILKKYWNYNFLTLKDTDKYILSPSVYFKFSPTSFENFVN